MRTGLIACALLLAACATPAPEAGSVAAPDARARELPASTPPPLLALPRVAAADLGGDMQLNQHLSISRNTVDQLSDEHEIDVALAIEGQHLKLAAVGLGLRLITLDYDGKTVSEQRHPLLPAVVNGERILRDMVLTWWPLHSLQPLLPVGWTLEEDNARRQLLWQGQPVMVIHYNRPGPRRWEGGARLENLQHGYRLTIVAGSP